MRVDSGRELYLLKLYGLLLFLGFLLALLTVKTVFAEVHDLAYGRICLRRHKAEVKPLVICHLKSLVRAHYSELLSVSSDNSYLGEIDRFVNESVL